MRWCIMSRSKVLKGGLQRKWNIAGCSDLSNDSYTVYYTSMQPERIIIDRSLDIYWPNSSQTHLTTFQRRLIYSNRIVSINKVQMVHIKVFTIEFITFAIDFIPFAVESIPLQLDLACLQLNEFNLVLQLNLSHLHINAATAANTKTICNSCFI